MQSESLMFVGKASDLTHSTPLSVTHAHTKEKKKNYLKHVLIDRFISLYHSTYLFPVPICIFVFKLIQIASFDLGDNIEKEDTC